MESSRIYPIDTDQKLVCKLPVIEELQSLICCQKPVKTKCENHFCELEEIIYTYTNLQTNFIETTQIHSINTHKNLVPKIPTVQKFESVKYTHKKRQN